MNVQGVVIDLDGTVYLGDEPLPGAADALANIRNRGLDVVFVTNNPTKTREAYVETLLDYGIEVDIEEVLSAGTVTARHLQEYHPDDAVFLVGSDGLTEQLRAANVSLTDDPDAADVVVTSHDHEFDYDDMTHALWALADAEAFYGSDPDLIYPGKGGRPYPGSGAITRAVAGVARREPDRVLGKPSGPLVELAMETLGHPPDNVLVVGDGLDTDIEMGVRAGAWTAFVLSGRGTREDIETASVDPDFVLDGLRDVPDLLDR